MKLENVFIFCSLFLPTFKAEPSQPHIIFIFADDLGELPEMQDFKTKSSLLKNLDFHYFLCLRCSPSFFIKYLSAYYKLGVHSNILQDSMILVTEIQKWYLLIWINWQMRVLFWIEIMFKQFVLLLDQLWWPECTLTKLVDKYVFRKALHFFLTGFFIHF